MGSEMCIRDRLKTVNNSHYGYILQLNTTIGKQLTANAETENMHHGNAAPIRQYRIVRRTICLYYLNVKAKHNVPSDVPAIFLQAKDKVPTLVNAISYAPQKRGRPSH